MSGLRWQTLRRWASTCIGAIDALVYPMACLICEAEGARSPWCESCREEISGASGRACSRCAMPLGPWAGDDHGCSECRGRPLGFNGAIALGPYQGPLRHLCLMLKHEPNAWLARWMADALVEVRGDSLASVGAEGVVAVPLHWRRRWRRGYNQADALAARLASRLGLRQIHALHRVEATKNLARMGRSERAKVMRGAFRNRRGVNLEGRTVLLVDDILTTGATCGAAARALKRAGAARVVVAVIGRAEGRA